MSELSQFIAAVMPLCLKSTERRELFLNWERHGFHVTPVHFYQPIPDTQSLPETLWSRPSELVGIDMNDSVQLDLLRNHFPKFRDEYEQFPTEPLQTWPVLSQWPFRWHRCLGRLLHDPPFSATVDHRSRQRFFFSAFWAKLLPKTRTRLSSVSNHFRSEFLRRGTFPACNR